MADVYAYQTIRSDEDGEYVGVCAEFTSLSRLRGRHAGLRRNVCRRRLATRFMLLQTGSRAGR